MVDNAQLINLTTILVSALRQLGFSEQQKKETVESILDIYYKNQDDAKKGVESHDTNKNHITN